MQASREARTADRSAPGVQDTNRIEGQRRWFVLAAVMITMFFSSMDQTVVSTAMPVVIGQLHGLDLYAWVFTAYIMASAVTVPIYGKLSDMYGRKPFYIFGLIVFMIGSAVAGQSHSMMELVLARAFQGIGGGAMVSMPRATVGDIFNPRERGRWMGILTAVFGLASIIGPSLGGWITDSWGWSWVFYINLPIAAVALGMVWRYLPTVRTAHAVRPDYGGISILIVALMGVLLGFTWAGSTYAWGSWQILSLFALGAVGTLAFILYERRTVDPIIAPELFKNQIFSSTLVIGLLVSMGMFGGLLFIPLYVQGVLSVSAAGSGAVLTPMMLSFIVGAMVSGQLMTRTGHYKLQSHIAALFMVAGMFLLSQMNAQTTLFDVIRNLVVLGVGIGGLLPLLSVVAQNVFPYEVMGTVNSTQQFVSSLGGVIAAPLLGAIVTTTFAADLAARMPAALKAALAHASPATRAALANPQSLTSQAAQQALRGEFSRFGQSGAALYHQFLGAVHVSLANGIGDLFQVALYLSIAAFFATLFLREVPLKHDEFFQAKDGAEGNDAQPEAAG